MAKRQAPWHAILPGGKQPVAYTLDELRAAKHVHGFLTEPIDGPAGIAYHIRSFRYLLFFGIACVAQDKFPALTRCWKGLEKLFVGDPAFDDDVFVQSWILMDFPFGPARQTALDYFEEFLRGTDAAPQLQRFINEARKSRLGLHQDVMRAKKLAKFRELFTGNVISTQPYIEEYGQGEILLVRTIAYEDEVHMFGHPKGFPKETKGHIMDMIQNKLFFLHDDFPGDATPAAQYEVFMKLAGPYWMSCVTKNEDTPILDPDHYRTYLG